MARHSACWSLSSKFQLPASSWPVMSSYRSQGRPSLIPQRPPPTGPGKVTGLHAASPPPKPWVCDTRLIYLCLLMVRCPVFGHCHNPRVEFLLTTPHAQSSLAYLPFSHNLDHELHEGNATRRRIGMYHLPKVHRAKRRARHLTTIACWNCQSRVVRTLSVAILSQGTGNELFIRVSRGGLAWDCTWSGDATILAVSRVVSVEARAFCALWNRTGQEPPPLDRKCAQLSRGLVGVRRPLFPRRGPGRWAGHCYAEHHEQDAVCPTEP